MKGFLVLFILCIAVVLILDQFKIIKPPGPFVPPFTIARPN